MYNCYFILLLFNCASASNAVSLPPLWYQSHSFLAGDNGVVFSVSPSVFTRNFGTTDRRVGSPQSIHTILVLTLNYHVFLTTVAFRNTYPNQPYTSHALHALSWLKRALQFGYRNSLYV